MSKKSKILLGIIVLAISFGASVFGTYEYNNYKVFNNLANQGKQYMLQKNYDKAIQAFQQALGYKKDADIQNSLILAQNLKNENSKKDIISKNIQLATDAAKNNKYDDANKYLDEVLKVDPDNSEAKSLKDSYAKAVQSQQETAAAEAESQKQAAKITSTSNTTKGVTSKQAYNIAVSHFKDFDISPEGETIDKNYLPSKIVNNYYLFYSEWKYDHSANDGLIGVNKTTGNIVWIRPDGKIEN